MDQQWLPSFRYYLDESDPDIFVLRRQDDMFVAAFSARGATKEGICEVAEEDYRVVIRSWTRTLGQAVGEQEERSA